MSSNDVTPSETIRDEDEQQTSSEAAGIVRGLSRSIRGVVRFPAVGRLPRQAIKAKLPVSRVARLSDRISTGLDTLQTAVDASAQKSWRRRITNFASSLVKNTLLGAAVFETYESTVSALAPPQPLKSIQQCGGHDDESAVVVDALEHDAYARASLSTHYFAGACGGSVHAIASTFWESLWNPSLVKTLPAMTIHHGIAHSVLFGSYETTKRALVTTEEHYSHNRHEQVAYFASVTLAGGIAGSIQQVVSTYTEQWLRIGIVEEIPQPFTRHMVKFHASPPTLRSVAFAFPPSAISFVAFEYGKSLLL